MADERGLFTDLPFAGVFDTILSRYEKQASTSEQAEKALRGFILSLHPQNKLGKGTQERLDNYLRAVLKTSRQHPSMRSHLVIDLVAIANASYHGESDLDALIEEECEALAGQIPEPTPCAPARVSAPSMH